MQLHRPYALALGAFTLIVTFAVGACSEDPAPALVLKGEDPLFAGLDYDTGLQPAGSPVQLSLAVVAEGGAKVEAQAVASGSADDPTLSGVPGTGTLTVGGSFGLQGRLVADVGGLPSYDGPIPGIENVAIEFGATTPFDPFALGGAVTTRADIPAATLPRIPLPGGIPGGLDIEVAAGSFVEVTLTGEGACVVDQQARYQVALTRAGALVLAPSVVVEIPIVGDQTFDIPAVEVPLDLGATSLALTADVDRFGGRPEEGDHQSGACSGEPPSTSAGAGGRAGAGGGSSTVSSSATSTGGGTLCTSAADCGGLPCVEGTCSPGGGACDSGLSLGQVDACLSDHCCGGLEACTFGYTDVDGCNECLADGDGPRCDGLLNCLVEHCNALPPAWTCDAGHYGSSDGCDCGCGAHDPDCMGTGVGVCDYCDTTGSCGTGPCPANIDPVDNAVCL